MSRLWAAHCFSWYFLTLGSPGSTISYMNPLAPARGILIGLLLGITLWLVIILTIVRFG
jgi:hypothetical protein